jgi:trehalose 6-phosphate phosphatase
MSPDLSQALAELGLAPSLLVALDFDGTLSALVAEPSAARPVPGALELLARLSQAPATQVVLVSGRSRRDLASVSGAADIAVLVGSHGQEMGADLSLSADESVVLAAVRASVAGSVGTIAGVRVEDKPAGMAIHVRGCADPDALRAIRLVEALVDQFPGTHVLEGKLVIEVSLRPLDKGSALRALIEADPTRRVLFAGDDVTDELAMAALRPTDVTIKVGPGGSVARYRVPGPEAVVEVLAHLARVRMAAGGQIGSR